MPLDWAATQNNLGNALQTLGAREDGTQRLDEAVGAYRAALEVRTRERVPLDWAAAQNNLGNALQTLGEREDGTQRLDEAVGAYRAALEVRTRERVPLDWAMTQNNLGNALSILGEREDGTPRGSKRRSAPIAPPWRSGRASASRCNGPGPRTTSAARSRGSASARTAPERLEEAVAAYRAALEVRTRERVPLDWAMTQNNLGTALQTLGAREDGTQRLEEAVGAYRAALEVFAPGGRELLRRHRRSNLARAEALLAERRGNRAAE